MARKSGALRCLGSYGLCLLIVLAGCKECDQGTLDRGWPGRGGDLRAHQVRHVENVHYAFAECGDMCGGNVEVELGQRCREFIEQAGSIEARDLDHRVAVRPLVVDGDRRLHRESADTAFGWRS